MTYTISQAAEKMNLSAYTLRYYEREGLLPFLSRTGSGIRAFSEQDMEMLSVICCLKATGMSIKQIREFINDWAEGDSTLNKRRRMLTEHRKTIIRQMEDLNKNLAKIDEKLNCYACAGRASEG
jgi:DNA-binding transcriptional MerR regulator